MADALRHSPDGVINAEVHDAGQYRADPRVAASWLERYADWAERLPEEDAIEPAIPGMTTNTVHRQPYGVCAQIIPFNAPLLMAVINIGPALAAGNTVVLKPSELASTPVLEFGRLVLERTELPNGVLNVITGDSLCGQVKGPPGAGREIGACPAGGRRTGGGGKSGGIRRFSP